MVRFRLLGHNRRFGQKGRRMKYAIAAVTLAAGFFAGRLLKMKQEDPEEPVKGMSVIVWVVLAVAVYGVGLGTVYMVKQLKK